LISPVAAFRHASIKTKLNLLILSVCTVILFLSAAFSLARTILEGRQRLLNGVAMTARLLGEYCVVPLSFDDSLEAGRMLERVQSVPGIQHAALYDSSGTLFAVYPAGRSRPDVLVPGKDDSHAFAAGWLTYSHRIVFRDQFLGTLVLRSGTAPLRRAAYHDAALVGALFAGLVLLSYPLALKMQAAISRPILHLTEAFRRVSDKGELSQRVSREGRDELGELYAGYNHMLDQLQSRLRERDRAEAEAQIRQQQLLQAGKLVTLGTLVSGVAHEINNPNTYIMLNASLALKQLKELEAKGNGQAGPAGIDPDSLRRFSSVLENVLQGSKRIDSIVKRLKDYYRKDQGRAKDSLDVNAIAEKAIEILDAKIRKATRHFRFERGGSLPPVAGHFQELEQVLINLLENACQALPDPEGEVVLRTVADGSRVIVEVEDTGVGIPPEHLDRIVDPFFTTKRENGGTGLGLSLVVSILNDHGGSLRFGPRPLKGTVATVTLPALG
jgi:signal transduction histidine kinase